jgi:peptidoglycan/xylan/chitin deacetylase (PgdA/CDA1 family)
MKLATRVLSRALYYTGLIGLHNKLCPRRKIVILCAHEGILLPRYINYLYKTCKIISLDDFLEIHRGNAAIPDNAVVLTFDDGYRDNYTEVYPILKKYKIPATIFLTVKMIGTGKVLWWSKVRFAIMNTKRQFAQMNTKRWKLNTPRNREQTTQELCKLLKEMPEQPRNHRIDELITSLDVKVDEKKLPQMLTWEQVKEMSDNGITFGAHTLNHTMLTKIPLEDARKEISGSKRVLEEKIQKPVKYFAYPYGTETDYNEDIKNIVRESGYACALTFIAGYGDHNSDIFTLGRMALYVKKPELEFMLSSLRWILLDRR